MFKYHNISLVVFRMNGRKRESVVWDYYFQDVLNDNWVISGAIVEDGICLRLVLPASKIVFWRGSRAVTEADVG